ncbi:MAG: MarR family winged helix-turn-helix transcriptional regulator [Rhizobiaceae bacterium]|jgi:DNA-binding MarR family transcriptional regulator|nr:MarR family winged helix-turn-helix transcriptional regulator [Rhizobiaceae bacterium]
MKRNEEASASLPNGKALARLFELVARSLHSAGHVDGLYPAQWTALRYLNEAEPDARTAAKLAQFQQLAPGPVTRSVRTLITKGLVREAGTASHHRAKRLEVTEAGIALLANDPLIALEKRLAKLGGDDARALERVLAQMLVTLQNDE